MNLKLITDQLRDVTHDKLLELANWCQSEATKRDPVKIAFEKALSESFSKYQAEQDQKEAEEARLVAELKKILKTGVRLKMKGCKDRCGLREFIRWNGDNLVCWQIIRKQRYVGGDSKNVVTEEFNTNQVTTHMADKVQEIYIDGTSLKIKSILK